MIASLRGILAVKQPGLAVIDVQGVGYEVVISARTYDRLPASGEEAFLVIQMAVREDAITLFGFAAAEEKELFLLLNSVSGIGPRLAMAVLSGMAAEELVTAIAGKDTTRLTGISGVGKKTAQRICMELQDKMTSISLPGASAGTMVMPIGQVNDDARQDAASALINLGYSEQLAWQAIRKVAALHPDRAGAMPVEEWIRRALQALAG